MKTIILVASGLLAMVINSQLAFADLLGGSSCGNNREFKVKSINVGNSFYNYYNLPQLANTRYNKSVFQIEQDFKANVCANKPAIFRFASSYHCSIESLEIVPVRNINGDRQVKHSGCTIRLADPAINIR